jgi:repressor LexA
MLRHSERPLTSKQREIYGYLASHVDYHGYAPTLKEIAKEFGYKSLATVHEHLSDLERKGWLRRRYCEARAIELLVRLDEVVQYSAAASSIPETQP